MILLDTNVVSELMRQEIAPVLAAFLRAHRRADLFTSAICAAEIRYGIARLPSGRRRACLAAAFDALMRESFDGRVLPFDAACAEAYAAARAKREQAGNAVAIADALIAATALVHGAAVATRNVRDFEGWGLELLNPWDAPQISA